MNTHPDADHITGMPSVLKSFSVDKFYMPEKSHTTDVFERMIDAASANGCEAIYAKAGNYIINNDSLSAQFLSPSKTYSNNNNSSAVVRLIYDNNSFLFTGDAEYDAERDMLEGGYDVHADVLKIGHHGSQSSTSAGFLKTVSPRFAVISVGTNNKYGHPSERVLSDLRNMGVEVYRTDKDGTIIFSCDGTNYTIDRFKSEAEANSPPTNEYIESENAYNEPEAEYGEVTGQYTQPEIYTGYVTEQSGSETVYITQTGSKYHRDGCSYIKKSKVSITVSEAKSKGYTPCSKCNPPQ